MYAIRFLPIDPRDPSPALYLSTDDPARMLLIKRARVTSVRADVRAFPDRGGADLYLHWAARAQYRCRRDHLRADVVLLADALRDLEAT